MKNNKGFTPVIIILIILSILVLSGSTYYLIKKTDSTDRENIYFNENSIYPDIKAEINKQFSINLGQIAFFDEGFKIMFIGYESGCPIDVPNELKNIIIKRAEASQCPTDTRTVYAVIKKGEVFSSDYELYSNGYNIKTISNSINRDKSEDIIVSLLPKSETEKLQDISIKPKIEDYNINETLTGKWIHSYEEETSDYLIYKNSKSYTPLPSRFRHEFTFLGNGMCSSLQLSSNDSHYDKVAKCSLSKKEEITILNLDEINYKIIEESEFKLILQKI